MKIRRSLGMTGLSQSVSFVLSFISVIVVSRLLTPEEIGVFSVAVAVLGFAHIFREFGVGQYLIRAQYVGREELRAAFTVTLITSSCIALVLFLLGKPLAAFYGHPGVAEVLAWLAVNFLIMPFGTPLLSLIQRDLQFDKLARGTIVGAVAHMVVTIGSAWLGASYLSMAYGAIASHVAKTLTLNLMRPGEIWMWPSLKGTGEVLRFGSVIGLGSIVKEFGTSAPDLILGKTLGFADVAIYSRAVGLRRMLMTKIVTIVSSVFFPAYAKGVREGGVPAELFVRTMNYIVAVTVPLLLFLSVMAQPMILFLFGEQWTRAVPLAVMVCAYSALAAPYVLSSQALTAVGRAGLLLRLQVWVQSVRIGILLLSVWLPLEQVVAWLGVAFAAEAWLTQRALKEGIALGAHAYLWALWPALRLVPFALLGPLASIWALQQFSEPGSSAYFITLVVGGTTALTGWLVGAFYTRHPWADEVRLLGSKLPFLRKVLGKPGT